MFMTEALSTLSPVACRVLGVLVEKAFTVASQYPLTLNALTTGCGQKNNRNPVRDYDEASVLEALDELRGRQLAMTVDMTGSRVLKYRHMMREALGVSAVESAILAELMLRGPQTTGELRANAGRMFPIESAEACAAAVESLMTRDQPLVRRLPRAAGERAERYVQLLNADLHPLHASESIGASAPIPAPSAGSPPATDLLGRIERLEAQVAELRRMLGGSTGA
jgi:hypothetical protein